MDAARSIIWAGVAAMLKEAARLAAMHAISLHERGIMPTCGDGNRQI
jgi:hypothetical protein